MSDNRDIIQCYSITIPLLVSLQNRSAKLDSKKEKKISSPSQKMCTGLSSSVESKTINILRQFLDTDILHI